MNNKGYQLQEKVSQNNKKFFHKKWPVEISVDVSVRVQAGGGGNTFQNVYKNKVTS